MRIDLFESRRYTSESHQATKSLETRKFSLDPHYPLEEVRNYVACRNDNVINEYIQHCKDIIQQGRFYTSIGNKASCDSLFEVEALGIGQYCMEYQVLIDMSDYLDYALHRLCGCSTEAIRKIPNYHEISYALLNFDFSNLPSEEFTFNSLLGADQRLDMYFRDLSESIYSGSVLSIDEASIQVAYKFYDELLSRLCEVKDYVAIYLSKRIGDAHSGAYRSKNFSTSIVSSKYMAPECVELVQEHFDTLVLPLKCYKRYEYAAKEVFRCDSCRKC